MAPPPGRHHLPPDPRRPSRRSYEPATSSSRSSRTRSRGPARSPPSCRHSSPCSRACRTPASFSPTRQATPSPPPVQRAAARPHRGAPHRTPRLARGAGAEAGSPTEFSVSRAALQLDPAQMAALVAAAIASAEQQPKPKPGGRVSRYERLPGVVSPSVGPLRCRSCSTVRPTKGQLLVARSRTSEGVASPLPRAHPETTRCSRWSAAPRGSGAAKASRSWLRAASSSFPKNVPHAYRITSAKAEVLIICTPGGSEGRGGVLWSRPLAT